jgi:hypothetical protein
MLNESTLIVERKIKKSEPPLNAKQAFSLEDAFLFAYEPLCRDELEAELRRLVSTSSTQVFCMYLTCCASYCFWYSFTLNGSYSTLYFNILYTTLAIACAVATVAWAGPSRERKRR